MVSLGIKELKNFLRVRGVRVPGSVNEKSDLVDLVEQSKDLPVRSEEELQRAAAAAEAAAKAAAEARTEAAKKEEKKAETEDKEKEDREESLGSSRFGFCGTGERQWKPKVSGVFLASQI
eukprot:Skav224456  [mRNA]  locus=scaffold1302:32065:32648:+ [translate_table: standard]